MNKKCTKCLEEKEIAKFYFQNKQTNIRMSWCKTCHNSAAYARKRAKTKDRLGYNKTSTIEARQLFENHQRLCPKCQVIKDLSEYYTCGKNNRGYDSYCKSCKNDYMKTIYKPEKHAKVYKDNKIARRYQKIKRKFNLSFEQYNALLSKQNSRCAICNKSQEENNKALAIDHRHSDGLVRELLCSKCNAGLGFLDENIDKLKAMIVYLEKWKDVVPSYSESIS